MMVPKVTGARWFVLRFLSRLRRQLWYVFIKCTYATLMSWWTKAQTEHEPTGKLLRKEARRLPTVITGSCLP
jgi:hypothetical protein